MVRHLTTIKLVHLAKCFASFACEDSECYWWYETMNKAEGKYWLGAVFVFHFESWK